MRHIWRAIRLIPEYRGRVVGVLVFGAATGLVATIVPYIYKAVVDVVATLASGHATAGQAATHMLRLLALFFGVRVGGIVVAALQQRQADHLWLDAVSTFRQRVFDNMTRLSIDYFERTRVGEIMDRFGAITTITMWLNALTEGTMASLLQLGFVVTALVVKAPLIGCLMAATAAFNLWFSFRAARWTKPHRRGWQRLAGKMAGLLAEMIGNIATVRSFGGEPAVKERYDGAQAEWRVTRGRLHTILWWTALTLNVVNTLAVFTAVAITAYGALHGRFTTGDILLVLTLSQSLVTIVGPISKQINQAADIDATAERLVELLEVETQVDDAPDAIELATLGAVEFEHVSFTYPGQTSPALEDVSFRLAPGETLALVGPSGAGKTTIVKLLLRFYDPSAGRILVNGEDLRRYTQRSLRAKVGVVLQDVALFNDSIGENISFARRGASPDEVREAAIAAHADDFIARLDKSYDTLVGERGIKLSGGEKQRVAIARAILKDPELIILDEATSALDSQSERVVQQGLARLLEARSSVIIAHRLSTVMAAHQILVVQNGRVVERGRHAALAARAGGLYARLCALQSEGRLADAPFAEPVLDEALLASSASG
jgi:ABC-type multidrug transport system fused ATPase/permease subunit